MNEFLQEAKAQLTNHILLREHWVETEYFDRFLAQASSTEKVELARWMYEENHPGIHLYKASKPVCSFTMKPPICFG